MTNDTIKKLGNKKIIIGVMALLSMLAVIIVGSIFPFTITSEKIFTIEWVSNELFIVFITIYSVVCVMFIGQASNNSDERSNIAKARVRYRALNAQINFDYFIQWVEQILEPRDQESVIKQVLRKVGIKQQGIIDLPRGQIKSLIGQPQRLDNKWFDEITIEQYNTIMDIFNGKYNIKFVNPRYYLTETGKDAELTVSERATREQMIKTRVMVVNLVSKILMVLIVGIVFSMFGYDVLTEQEIATSLMNLFSRILALTSSSFVGYMTGTQINDITASYLEMKSDIQKEFLEDKNFKPKTIEEIAKEKFIFKQKFERKAIEYEKQQDTNILD